jgi:hypothetical protein
MRTRHLFIFAAILFITWAASCTKTTTAPVIATDTVVNAQIANVRLDRGSGDTENYRIVYNAQNQVDSIIETTYYGTVSVSTFIYSGLSYVVLNSGSSGAPSDSVALNADGTVNTINSGYYDAYNFSYNSNGLSQRDEIYSTEQIFTNYVWVNGDIDSSYTTPVNSGGSGSEIYYYDLRHHWQMGDAISINDFLAYGRPTVHSKHLMTQTSNNSSPTQYAYKFDSRGRITQLTQNGMIYYYTYTN